MDGTAAVLPAIDAALNTRNPCSASQSIGKKQRNTGNDNNTNAHSKTKKSHLPDLGKIKQAAKGKSKKGIISRLALPRKSPISLSRLPNIIATTSSKMLPTSACHGKTDSPANPNVTIVKNGPYSRHIIVWAPTSRRRQYWPINAI